LILSSFSGLHNSGTLSLFTGSLKPNTAFNVALEWYPQLLDTTLGFVVFYSDFDFSSLGMYTEYIILSEIKVVGV